MHPDQRVLDFGCGFGLRRRACLAPLVAEVWLWDPSPNMRVVTRRNTANIPNARFVRPLDHVRRMTPQRDDVAWDPLRPDPRQQRGCSTWPPTELWAWLGRWRDMLVARRQASSSPI